MCTKFSSTSTYITINDIKIGLFGNLYSSSMLIHLTYVNRPQIFKNLLVQGKTTFLYLYFEYY